MQCTVQCYNSAVHSAVSWAERTYTSKAIAKSAANDISLFQPLRLVDVEGAKPKMQSKNVGGPPDIFN